MSSKDYAVVDLEEKKRNGCKWILGPFYPEGSDEHSKLIEIGYVDLQEVEKTDRFHFHTHCEEYYVLLDGHMQIQVGKNVIEVSRGQVLLVRPSVPHLILKVQPGTRILLIKVPPGQEDKTIISES